MNSDKVRKFMTLGGQPVAGKLHEGSEAQRKLGAHLLLTEVLEYVIRGLGVVPSFGGTKISDPEAITFEASGSSPDKVEMLDGLADTAYTMYWNALAFGVPLDRAFELVCDNNLEKFVLLEGWSEGSRPLERGEWECGREVQWPSDVVTVEVIAVGTEFYAVGKDARGKVRKPSTFRPVELAALVA